MPKLWSSYRPWTAEEDDVIRMCFVECLSSDATRRAVNALPANACSPRSARFLADRERSLGFQRTSGHLDASPEFYRGDLRFKRAMIKAVKAGLEKRVFFGVIKDRSPIPPSVVRYDRGTTVVPTQSIAGECVDRAD
jgi:hypothetical protein